MPGAPLTKTEILNIGSKLTDAENNKFKIITKTGELRTEDEQYIIANLTDLKNREIVKQSQILTRFGEIKDGKFIPFSHIVNNKGGKRRKSKKQRKSKRNVRKNRKSRRNFY